MTFTVAGYELDPDRHYDPHTNLWVAELGPRRVRLGYDPLGAETSGDIVAISTPPVGTRLARGETLATVEAAKFVGPMPAPVAGTLRVVNADVIAAPGAINADPMNVWVAELDDADSDDLGRLVTGEEAIRVWFAAAVERFRREGALAE